MKFFYKRNENFDKNLYDKAASKFLNFSNIELIKSSGTYDISPVHRPPFDYYYELIKNNIKPSMTVLELGSGMGRHTGILIETGASIYVNDISSEALKVCKRMNPEIHRVIESSMDDTKLDPNSIDVIVSCGALSYVDPKKLDQEIIRLLRPNGKIIIIDSLNENPIYKINRFIRFLLGKRSWNSIRRIPSLQRINLLRGYFQHSEIKFFGSYLWIILPLKVFLNSDQISKINSNLEKRFKSRRHAFKFVLIAKQVKPTAKISQIL
jgi:SAM-dependent methyltransferase